jgi:hypothetical protein
VYQQSYIRTVRTLFEDTRVYTLITARVSALEKKNRYRRLYQQLLPKFQFGDVSISLYDTCDMKYDMNDIQYDLSI